MADVEALRKLAEAAPTVTIDSEDLLELLDSVIVVTLNGVKKRAKREKAPMNPDDEKCARWMHGVLLKTYPKARTPNFTTWANEVRRMRELDCRAHREICELFKWAQGSRFWKSNIRSPSNLREHWDGLWIQRETEREPKLPGAGAWWVSDETRLAKALEVGVGPARPGDTKESYEARIRAAIDNGGKPPPAQVFVRPAAPADLAPAQGETRMAKPAGFLKQMLRQAQVHSRASEGEAA